MLGDNVSATASIPDKAVMTLTKQEGISIIHLLFAHTTVRGKNTEVIEDTVPLYNVECTLKADKKPSRVYMAPENRDIPFTFDEKGIHFTVDRVDIHSMTVIED